MIIGDKELVKELGKIQSMNTRTGIKEAISFVQENAKSNCPTNYGELRESIYIDVEYDAEICRGICYTNKSYGPYVEFGTGPNGQASHEGISPNVAVAYNQKGWMIPGNAMTLRDAEKYGFGVVKRKDGMPMGYLTNGQAAQPFMYPALKDNEEKVIQIIFDHARRQL